VSNDKRPIEIDDLYKIVKVEDPRISPDGKWIAFVRVTIDRMENGYKRSIWLVPTGGGEPRPLTRSGKDSTPRWSPDGETLAFVSARSEKPQVYLLPLGPLGGEARPLTSMPNGAVSPEWSPDGTHIAFLASSTQEERDKEDSDENDAPPKDQLEAKQREERRKEDEKKRQDPYRAWRIPYREGTSFRSERYGQIYVVAVDEALEGEDAKPRRLTSLDVDFQPVRWSPDGAYLYTGRQSNPENDQPFTEQVLYRIRVEDGEATALTDDSHTSFGATPSPDGKTIAFVRLPRGKIGDLEAIPRLSIMAADGGEVTDLNLTLDRSVGDFGWTKDSSALLFTATNEGVGPLYRVSASGGAVETLHRGDFIAMAMDVGPDGGVAATISTPTNPGELAWFEPDGSAYATRTAFNDKWLDEVIVQETHEFRFKSPSGTDIQGWYLLPVGYEEGKTYPLALNIHGGPRAMWGPGTDSMFHEWQVHAASGYVVFYCNPRGGDGYGETFQRDLHAAWGDVAMADIMAGVDALLKEGAVDEKRMAITGGSYGGYMTSWIVGHTERFVSAVTQRGVYHLSSFYGTSDIPILISSDFGVEPWENHELLWRHSPVAYAHKITTPLLIIHAENDYRVPIEQAEQLFAWVRRATDTPVELVRYPRDGHELSRSGEPAHRVSRLERMVEWFDRYCK
jgi:dipeptidyl aminopeptidase/acylaminoacyl peptidase